MLKRIYVFALLLTMTLAAGADFSAHAQRPYRVTDRQVETLLRTLEQDVDVWSRDFEVALDRSSYNGTRTEDEIKNYIVEFENATDRLKERFGSRTSVGADVEEVLSRAANIDRFLNQYRFNARVTTGWNRVRTDLNQLATFYNVRFDWNRTTGFPTTGTINTPSRVNDQTVASLLQVLERDADFFSRTLTNALDRSTYNGTATEDEIIAYVREFENATDSLKRNFDARNAASADVSEVLNRAAFIDDFLRRNRLPARANNDWSRVRSDLTQLATYYNVSWNWNQYDLPSRGTGFPTTGGTTNGSNRLNGTYRLDTVRSANVEAEIDRAIGDLPLNQRDRVRRNALRRLEAPDVLAIERSGNEIRLASSKSPQVTFLADGRTRTEAMPNGRSMSVNANVVNEQVVINYSGDRANDFYVAFNPLRNGDELRVTRRIYLEGVNRQITVDSLYTRTSNVAEFNTVFRGDNTGGIYDNNTNTTTNADFVIPNGTRLTAVLNTDLDTKTAQVGDRFTMEVTSPGEYNGAIIEGRVASVQRSGRVTGRAGMGLDFDTIRFRNSTYRFAGLLDSVSSNENGNVSISNEGQVREENSQTNKTVTRTAIGAALGAIIGAIAGGGEGAAIGAGVGAGAGAGSVILQGRDDLVLKSGTQVNVTASAPRNVVNR